MVYSLGMEPSDLGSEQFGGGVRCRLVSSFFPFYQFLININ